MKTIKIKLKTSNSDLYSKAWKDIKGQWWISIGAILLIYLITYLSNEIHPLIALLITMPLQVGCMQFWLNVSRRGNPKITDLLKGFYSYLLALGANILVGLKVLFGLLLLIIPGIYWALSYSMVNYIIAENPNIGINQSLVNSRVMMDGNKWKLFNFCLRAFVVVLACILTLGIGFFWGMPWISVAFAKFYDDIK